jgi:serine/threonine-protein kinase
LTFDGNNQSPSWSPRGDLVAFGSNGTWLTNLFVMPGDGGEPRRLSPSNIQTQMATGWSPDGKVVLFHAQNRGYSWDLWEASLSDGRARPLLVAQGSQVAARLSPDGRWLAYVSDESGRAEVYVRPYRGPDLKWTISVDGGFAPKWSRDGSELFYVSDRSGSYKLFAVPVVTTPPFRPGAPRILFERRGEHYGFDVTPDGQRFVVAEDAEAVTERLRIVIVPDWFDELRAKVPVPK